MLIIYNVGQNLKISFKYYIQGVICRKFYQNITVECSSSESDTVDRKLWWERRWRWKAGLVMMEPASETLQGYSSVSVLS